MNKDSLLALLSAKENQQTIKPIIFLRVGKLFPLVGEVLRVHCVLRVYLPLLQVHLEKLALVWRILLVGTDGSLYRSVRCLFYSAV